MVDALGLDHSMISEEHRQMWPFDFELVYTVRLSAGTLETQLRVQNIGDKAFDFNTLLHTYFLIPVSWVYTLQRSYQCSDWSVSSSTALSNDTDARSRVNF